ncbi:MAG: hypothetical protein AB7P49_07175 [Bdellovibrionales bacterium]
MYTSHVFFLIPMALAVYYVYPIDFVMFLRVTTYSTVYHIWRNGYHMHGWMDNYQRLDHTGVWATMLWLLLRTLNLDLSVLVAIQLAVTMLFEIFPDILVDTWVFPVVMIPSAVVIYVMMLFLYGIPFPRISITLVTAAIFFGVVGLVLFHMTSDYGEAYKIYHPGWHVAAALSLTFFYLAVLGFTFDTYFFGIDRHWKDMLANWESVLTGTYLTRFRNTLRKRHVV